MLFRDECSVCTVRTFQLYNLNSWCVKLVFRSSHGWYHRKGFKSSFLGYFLFGGGILRYLDQPKYRLSIFYILTVWSVYTFAIYYIKIQFSLRDLNGFLTSFILTINLFVTFIFIIIAVCEHEAYFFQCYRFNGVTSKTKQISTFQFGIIL